MTRPFILIAGLCASLVALACGKSDKDDVVTVQSPVKVNDEALHQKMEHAKAELAAKQRALAEEGRARLKTLDANIEELKQRAKSKSAEAKQAADEALAKLQAQREEARAALERAENATREQWESLQAGAKDALERVEGAYNQALDRLKTD